MRTRVRHRFGALLAGLAIAGALNASAPATAVGAPPTVVVRDATSDARAIAAEARALRRDVAALLQGYVDDYRDRFTPDEVATLLSYRDTADRHLATVVATTGRLRTAVATGSGERLAANRALTAWARARSAAERSWEAARSIMEPRLSLIEKVGALRDYDTMMDRFDRLGERLRAIDRTR
jgi:hypothetical protein